MGRKFWGRVIASAWVGVAGIAMRLDAATPEDWDLAVTISSVVQGTQGVERRLRPEEDVADGSVCVDAEITVPAAGGCTFYALVEAGSGDGVDGDVPTLSGLNDDVDPEATLRLTELWYERSWFADRLRLRGGQVDLTTDFDQNEVANCEIGQFLSPAFVNNPALEFPADNGPGLMLWISSREEAWDLGVAVADGDADWEDLFSDLFSMVELDLRPRIAGRRGNYRLYAWRHDGDHPHRGRPDRLHEENQGWGCSLDQELVGGVVGFLRDGVQRQAVAAVDQAWSAGLQWSGEALGRGDDTVGWAIGNMSLGRYPGDRGRPDSEQHLELYYRCQLDEGLSITPDVQWVRNPDGDESQDAVWTAGLRINGWF